MGADITKFNIKHTKIEEFFSEIDKIVIKFITILIFFSSVAFIFNSIRIFIIEEYSVMDILPIYLAITGLSIAFASVSFSYSRTLVNKSNTAILAGEYFLYTAVMMTVASLISWLGIKVTEMGLEHSYLFGFGYLLFMFGQVFALWSIVYFCNGLSNLLRTLYSRLENNNLLIFYLNKIFSNKMNPKISKKSN